MFVHFYTEFMDFSFTFLLLFLFIAHINHIKNIAGVDSVGLGSGFDGIN